MRINISLNGQVFRRWIVATTYVASVMIYLALLSFRHIQRLYLICFLHSRPSHLFFLISNYKQSSLITLQIGSKISKFTTISKMKGIKPQASIQEETTMLPCFSENSACALLACRNNINSIVDVHHHRQQLKTTAY